MPRPLKIGLSARFLPPRPGAGGATFLTYKLSDVLVTSYTQGGDKERPLLENVQLNFSKVEITFQPEVDRIVHLRYLEGAWRKVEEKLAWTIDTIPARAVVGSSLSVMIASRGTQRETARRARVSASPTIPRKMMRGAYPSR